LIFGVLRPKRLSVVGVEEFGEARQELYRRNVWGFGDGARRRAHPLSEAGERAADGGEPLPADGEQAAPRKTEFAARPFPSGYAGSMPDTSMTSEERVLF